MGKEADILAKIVVVEDDVYMREELLNLLEKSGYDTIGLSDFENAVSEIAAYFPDLILLDINLPFRSGFEICKELKAKQIGTVLVLTARDKLQDELHALDLGADDYLTKPFDLDELLARIERNLLRSQKDTPDLCLTFGELSINTSSKIVTVADEIIVLTAKEYQLVELLAKYPDKVYLPYFAYHVEQYF